MTSKGLTIDELRRLAISKKIEVDAICTLEDLFKFKDAKYIIYLMLPESGDTGHFVCMVKNKPLSFYFDSFGVDPPQEVVNYLGKPILYQDYKIQKFNTSNCGNICLQFLENFQRSKIKNLKERYYNIVLNFIK